MTNSLLAHDHSELDAALAAVFAALTDNEIVRSFNCLDLFWGGLAMHIRAENIQLFPTLLRAAENSEHATGVPPLETIQAAIARLRDDHDFFMSEITAAMKELRELQRGKRPNSAPVLASVREQMMGVSRRLEAHNALEESQVYHWADALLDEAGQTALNQSIQRELENLPPRFRKK